MQASQFRLNFFKLIIFFINSYIAYRFANHVIVSSNHIKNFISAKFKVNKLKITVINNYIDRNLFYINKKILDRKANRILFVGRLTKQKNLQELLHAISLTNFGLDIIGEGEDKSKLVKLVTKNKINVKFLGSINNKLIGSYYNNYKVFILPSYVEGNPKVLLEAMSCGCTVICSNVQGNNSIIKHKFNGYFVNTNRNSIKNGINEIMTNEQLQIKLNNNSIKYIEQYCDLEKNLLIEKNIYNLLVNEKKTIY